MTCQLALPVLWQLEVWWRAARLVQDVNYPSHQHHQHDATTGLLGLVRTAITKRT